MIVLLIFVILFGITEKPNMKQHRKSTPLSGKELSLQLEEAHRVVFDQTPSQRKLATAWAHAALENGQGSKIYNHNIGNIGALKQEPYFLISGYRFKANNSASDGARIYWQTLQKMCSSVLPYFDLGDVEGAAYQLHRCGYYRADKKLYARSMKQLYWKALKGLK